MIHHTEWIAETLENYFSIALQGIFHPKKYIPSTSCANISKLASHSTLLSIYIFVLALKIWRLINWFSFNCVLRAPISCSMECDPVTRIASGSSSIVPRDSSHQFDVFINHRGPDVKKDLASPLHKSLREAKIDAFLDEDIECAQSIPFKIKAGILSASVHIAIFSPRYAGSAWCLAELTLMLQTGAPIIPVFYNVKPSDLRHGLSESYKEALSNLKKNYPDHVEEWKKSLDNVSLVNGIEVIDTNQKPREESDLERTALCNRLVSTVEKLLVKRTVILESRVTMVEKRNVILQVARYKVGLDELIEDFERHRQKNLGERNGIVGICGEGGSGKTTLAKEFFNLNFLNYERASFLFDVRETSTNGNFFSLQSKLLTDLFPTWNQKITSTAEGRILLQKNLEKASPFLVVIDDVDDPTQLNALVPLYSLNENSKSLVIVIAREEGVLSKAGISSCYKMKEMNLEHGKELFSRHAFNVGVPPTKYLDLVDSFVKKCKCLPLYFQVLGGHVSADREENTWKQKLEKVGKNSDIKDILQDIYNALEPNVKDIFLDIACLFIEKNVKMATRLWEAKGWCAEDALQTLKKRFLVDLVRQDFDEEPPAYVFRMHDELRQFGREMAPGRQIHRPWHKDDEVLVPSDFEIVLRKEHGGFRCLNSMRGITYFLEKKNTLNALQWLELNSKCISSNIPLNDLEVFKIIIEQIPHDLSQEFKQVPRKLKELLCEFMNLHRTRKVILQKLWEKYSKSLKMLSKLECLILKFKSEDKRKDIVVNWSEFLKSVIGPTSLKTLDLLGCYMGGDLSICREPTDCTVLRSLEDITLTNLRNTSKVTISGDNFPKLKSLKIEDMHSLTEVNLEGLETLILLEVSECHDLKNLLSSDMPKLEILSIGNCSDLIALPNLQGSKCLKRIRIVFCEELKTIDGMTDLTDIKDITITCCPELTSLTGIEELQKLSTMILSGGSIWKCVSGMERLPSKFAVVMGTAATASRWTEDQIRKEIFTEYAYQTFGSREEGYQKLQSLRKSFSAIILFAMVVSDGDGPAYMDRRPQLGGTVRLSFGSEKELVYTIVFTHPNTIVFTHPNEISIISHTMPTFELESTSECLPPRLKGRIEKGYILGLNDSKDSISILKKIFDQLYSGSVDADL